MAKSPPKRLNIQSNLRTSTHLHNKAKRPKKPHQKLAEEIKETKFNIIMEQLDDLDENRYECNTNINHFAPIFESDNEEGTKQRTKSKTPIIAKSEDE